MSVPAPFAYNANVVDVHDGDTFSVIVDRGFFDYLGDQGHPIPVRLFGCNAIELNQPGGVEARDNLRALLPIGSPVVLRTAKPDKYAPRWDASVETPAIADLTAFLVQQSWAAAWYGTGTKPVPPWPRPLPQNGA